MRSLWTAAIVLLVAQICGDRHEALQTVIEQLQSDEICKIYAAQALQTFGPAAKDAVPLLLKVFDAGETFDLKVASIRALGAIGQAAQIAVKRLKQNDCRGSAEMETMLALAKIGGAGVDWILERMRNNNGVDRGVPRDVVDTLGYRGAKAVPWLIARLDHTEIEMRTAAARALAMWPVLSLLIEYCGSSFVARTVYPLNAIAELIFFLIVRRTRPASEFQPT